MMKERLFLIRWNVECHEISLIRQIFISSRSLFVLLRGMFSVRHVVSGGHIAFLMGGGCAGAAGRSFRQKFSGQRYPGLR